jgi:integrase
MYFFSAEHGRVMARVSFRDLDGVRRPVSRWGPTKAAAERSLRAALRDRTGPESGTLTADSRLSTLADLWLESVNASDLAVNSKRLYNLSVANYVKPTLGALRLREADAQAVDRALRAVKDHHGAGAAKTARSVLSGVFGLAVRRGALRTNPVRDTTPIPRTKRTIRALTVQEERDLTVRLRAHERAVELDLPDLVDFMLCTGVRIGEACAVRAGTNGDGLPLLDRQAGTFEVNATVIRVSGAGLRIQERPKSAAGWRVLALPPYVISMLDRRQSELRLRAPDGIVFGSPLGQLRDPNNTSGDLREVLDGIGCPECDGRGYFVQDGARTRCAVGPYSWVTSHVFRKTVATRLDAAGLSARQIADHLGHEKPSVTQDVYMGRKVVAAEAAWVLDRE